MIRGISVGLDSYVRLNSEKNIRLWNRRRILTQQLAIGKRDEERTREVPESPFGEVILWLIVSNSTPV